MTNSIHARLDDALGIPIVSRAWVRNIFRRVITDDPHIRLYHTARYILAEVFGEDWINENVGPARPPGGFLKNAFANETDAAAHFMRVTTLAEMILNLQRISGYSECASQLKTAAQIESTFAELEVGKLLYLYGIPFEFNTRTFVKRKIMTCISGVATAERHSPILSAS
jgi:hypothetical protein